MNGFANTIIKLQDHAIRRVAKTIHEALFWWYTAPAIWRVARGNFVVFKRTPQWVLEEIINNVDDSTISEEPAEYQDFVVAAHMELYSRRQSRAPTLTETITPTTPHTEEENL